LAGSLSQLNRDVQAAAGLGDLTGYHAGVSGLQLGRHRLRQKLLRGVQQAARVSHGVVQRAAPQRGRRSGHSASQWKG
jgi:hypothetical protein